MIRHIMLYHIILPEKLVLGRGGIVEQFVQLFLSYGLIGLIIASFTESFISPILPDILLIPMALAAPEKAIYYAVIATTASVLGGLIGYAAGFKFGPPLVERFIPPRYAEMAHKWIVEYGGWAIVVSALAPIPYKFVCITAGVFKVNRGVFLIASIIGRAKRFLLEGILIFYYGPKAVELMKAYSDETAIGLVVIVLVLIAAAWLLKRMRRQPSTE